MNGTKKGRKMPWVEISEDDEGKSKPFHKGRNSNSQLPRKTGVRGCTEEKGQASRKKQGLLVVLTVKTGRGKNVECLKQMGEVTGVIKTLHISH